MPPASRRINARRFVRTAAAACGLSVGLSAGIAPPNHASGDNLGSPIGSNQVTFRHLFGIKSVGGTAIIQLINGKSGQPVTGDGGSDTFAVKGYDASTLTVTLDKTLAQVVSDARNDYAVVATPTPGSATLTFTAKAKGAWGNSLRVRVRPMSQKESTTLSLLANPALDPTPITTGIKAHTAVAGAVPAFIEVNDKGLKADDVVDIMGARYTLKDLTAGADPKKFELKQPKPDSQDWNALKPAVRKIRRTNAAGATRA